ncbi:uncharacterized protein LOC129005984 [Macrosteles quadrilineatus]|uniref:uncharacterized protein LOC129005984 n=1 Tax=Macrosteles quadrilineatus TaxID=74068 RepID=UPI0023E175BB|nr:uncharacterized protein LOC129005984 [Macrosteles quadrilineatus]
MDRCSSSGAHLYAHRIDKKSPKDRDYLFIFFDLETRQDESLPSDPETKLHKVNLCVSQQFCFKCINGGECESCSERYKIFDSNPVRQFMNYVMEARKQFKNVCVIAHNGQGFDFQFILRYILEETKFTPNIIPRGTKIILMEVANVRFIDSLSYFPMSLSALPKAFDLPPEKKKGYFPHLFNTVANQNYIGPMPDKKYYCPESMFEKSHNDFDKWYNEQAAKKYEFNLKKELLEYCMSDVDILAQACIKFRSLLLEQCNVDPFLESLTIASACNLAFRRNFLKPNTIGLIPKNGYRSSTQSAVALQWLTWEEERRGVTINHAGRSKEVVIKGMKVDGFDGENIYEFHGCYWHGCPKCFPYNRDTPLKEDPSDSLHLRYERTKAKIEKLGDVVQITCGEIMYQGDCFHESEDRALVGTWTMDEIRKAVEKGYIIQDIYELWEYEVATYEKGGLFTEFIDKFLKLKQEASGYPGWCKTEEDKKQYIAKFLEREGIEMTKEHIVKNGGLRSVAKLMLNSFWGKFGQRENMMKTSIIRDAKEFFRLLTNPEGKLKYFQAINQDVVLVNWQNIEEASESLRTVNVVMAAFTTAHARLKLYEHLDALGDQVLYWDTDSIIYYYHEGLYRVPTGDYLGEMTDELVEYGPGSYITEFVSGGPKTYAYLVWSTNQQKFIPVCKIKGLTLNIKTSKILNFGKLKEMVLSEASKIVEIDEHRIRRTKYRDIVTTDEVKQFKVTGPKRKYEGDHDTLPYGYKKQEH